MKKKEEEENNSFRTLAGILLIIIIILVGSFFEKDLQDKRDQVDAQYKPIRRLDIQYDGIISSKSQAKGYGGLMLVHLSNNSRFSLSGGTVNYLYGEQDLVYFLHIVDSIYKPKNSDSIFIYRKDREYYFILGRAINNRMAHLRPYKII